MTSAEAERNMSAILSRPNSDGGKRVAELAALIVDTSTAKARKPKRGFLLGRPR